MIASVAWAQSEFGLKAGLNIANIGGDAAGVDAKIGFHAGLFGVLKISEKFGIQPEVVFSRQGAQAASNSKVKINYDYVNIPIMFSAYATEKVFFQAGPQIGILVGAKITDGSDDIDVKDQLEGVDLGLGLGAGYDTGKVLIGIRYNLGLTTTSKSDEGKFPNRVLQLSLGFKLNNF
jgi:hypothetical protein